MNKNLLDLSGKIDGLRIGLFETIAHVAEPLSIHFFVVGAMARDIILSDGYGIETGRRTEDIDLAAQVSDWEAYERLRENLVATGGFKPHKNRAQRLLYKELLPIDVIPFGMISDLDGFLFWPPKQKTKMSTLGFEEAYQTSIIVRMRVKPTLDIQFVSLPGLAVLKIISWNDNLLRRGKDAQDLMLLMRTYLDAGNQERLFNEDIDMVEEKDFDYVRASSRLLGRDIATILSSKTKKAILEILDRGTKDQNHFALVENMLDRSAESSAFEEALQLIEELKRGILERM